MITCVYNSKAHCKAAVKTGIVEVCLCAHKEHLYLVWKPIFHIIIGTYDHSFPKKTLQAFPEKGICTQEPRQKHSLFHSQYFMRDSSECGETAVFHRAKEYGMNPI